VPLDYYMQFPHGKDDKESEYFVLSGTSMAAAVVSGACALMIENDPSLTPDTIKARLMLSAEKSPNYGPLWQGAGYLDIPAALAMTVQSVDHAKSPTVVADDEGGVSIRPSPEWAGGDNFAWEPIAPPNPADMLQPLYPPEPEIEAYQPDEDAMWEAYEAYSWWPQWACFADLSEAAIYGEDFAEYLGKHGPKPPKNQ
jgi:subtilisin family serine protease